LFFIPLHSKLKNSLNIRDEKMVKKIIFAIALALVLAGGGAYYWYTKKPVCECNFSDRGLKTKKEVTDAYYNCVSDYTDKTFKKSGVRKPLDYYSFFCLYKARCFLPYIRVSVAYDLQSSTNYFLIDRGYAIGRTGRDFSMYDTKYLVDYGPERHQEFSDLLDNYHKVFISNLPCGEDTLKDYKFDLFYPKNIKERGVKMFGRKDFLKLLKTDTNLTNCCNEWKPYFDEIAYHFPHHSHLKIYDLYCIKRDTLLTECQEEEIVSANKEEIYFPPDHKIFTD